MSTAAGSAPVVPPGQAAFDLSEYIYHPRQINPEELDLAALSGLPAPVLLALDHALAVQEATLTWMRDLLLSPTHADAEVTAFLTTWAYEKYWLAHTLRQVLADQPAPPGPPAGALLRLRESFAERIKPSLDAIGTNLLGHQVVAGHMVTGLADTLSTRLTFVRLAELAPQLSPLSAAVLDLTERHVAFYTSQVRRRLNTDADSRRSIHRELGQWRWPATALANPDRIATVLRFLLAGQRARRQVEEVDGYLASFSDRPIRPPLRTEFGRFVVRGTTGG